MDNDKANVAKLEGKSYLPLFKKSTHNTNTMGTKEAIDHFLLHIRKGCFADPLPPEEMHYRTSNKEPSDGGPPEQNCKRGTNIVETSNLYGRVATLGEARRQRSELSDKRYLVFVCLHNLRMDAKVKHLTGKTVRSRDWFTREALRMDFEKLTRTVFENDGDFPPNVDLSQHMEPIGELYQLFNEWEKIDAEIRAAEEAQRRRTMFDEFGDFSGLADVDLAAFEPAAPAAVASPAARSIASPNIAALTPVASPVAAPMDGGQAEFSSRVQARNQSPWKRAKSSLFGAE